MALTSISMHIENVELNGMIKITSESLIDNLGNIFYIHIFRKIDDIEETFDKIYEIQIDSVEDLNFTLNDMTARSGFVYEYAVELADGNTTGYNIIEQEVFSGINSYFDGIFIGNDDHQYMARLNCSTNVSQNTQVGYINTLQSRTPYRISNTNLNYATGESSGLFLNIDSNGDLIVDINKEYQREVVKFLCDGTDKILKTHSGDIWCVSIDQAINIPFDNNYTGYNMISFNWTEIDDIPLNKKVVNQ